ncbi:MAG: hypothetical protein K2Q07_09935 [Burkholderiaceae bacterium]|nr:hypothetical protein [Burkholderiaceae bacterium]
MKAAAAAVPMLVRYVFCSIETGEIMGSMSADHDVGFVHVPAGHMAFESFEATPGTHYSNGTDLVAYTPEQAALKASKPAYAAQWSNDTCSWQDLRTLDGIRDEAAGTVLRLMDEAEARQVRPLRDYTALSLIALPSPEQVADRAVEAACLVEAYTLMQQLRTKLAAITAATTQAELDAATALPPT